MVKNYKYVPRPDNQCKHHPAVRKLWAEKKREYYQKKKREQKKQEEAK